MREKKRLGIGDLGQRFMRGLTAIFVVGAAILLFGTTQVAAQERVEVTAMQMEGFGRVVLTFPDRFDLPQYTISSENGVLALEFVEPLAVFLPDISGTLAQYVAISRVDPDKRGIRFGLTNIFNVNSLEAGEQLYVDFLPDNWQGLPPGLPAEVVAELARRAQDAAAVAELQRRIEFTRVNNPTAKVSVGRHPTFTRLTFDWSEDTSYEFNFADGVANLEFFWPVELDFYPLISNMPAEFVSIQSEKFVGSNRIEIKLENDVVPRFFKNSERQFVIDFDLIEPDTKTISAEELLSELELEKIRKDSIEAIEGESAAQGGDENGQAVVPQQIEITPKVSQIGSTIRIAFPFDRETSAAVFQRGNYLWMIMDTTTIINAPDDEQLLATISEDFATISAGDTQIVRMQMNDARLASLGSQGPSWILSLGENLMAPTEPIRLDRRLDEQGRNEIIASVQRPVRVHQLRDPEIGDILEVVTMFPPANGVIRQLSFVDFNALSSTHGLVIKPQTEELEIEIGPREIVLKSQQGLIVSSVNDIRAGGPIAANSQRQGFIDLAALEEKNPQELTLRRESLMAIAASSEGRAKENARLDLAHVLLANQLGLEAIGILNLLIEENQVADLMNDAILAKAAASVVAYRARDALKLLEANQLSKEVDQFIWRAIAKAQIRDFVGARSDILASELVIGSYPQWLQSRFFLAGILAAIETEDTVMARRLSEELPLEILSKDQRSQLLLLNARLNEFDKSYDEALDNYGLVIATDVRPTRAEAILRTVLLLEKMDRLEFDKAIQTLSRESIVWRGGMVEAQMLQVLARLQFANKQYRDGFSTVREAGETAIDNAAVIELSQRAQEVFVELYINGAADSMEHLKALTLFYDFRYLTPAGARGDEMIRGLARRLIRVDLLSQAASLLEYQIDVRLEGAARAQIAADLAIIYIANRDPGLALLALNKTSLANLPLSLDRQRRLLEGRALIDEGRMALAIDILSQLNGRDVELLRVDAYWSAAQYVKAAEQLEVIYSRRNIDSALTLPARMNLIKAAVGYVLGRDMLGLARVRSKFSERMVNFPEWPMFDYVTGVATATGANFKDVAAQIADIDNLSAFLNSYRLTYGGDGALTPAPGNGVS